MGKFHLTIVLAIAVLVMAGCAPRKTIAPPEVKKKIKGNLAAVSIPPRARGTLEYSGFRDFKSDFYMTRLGDTIDLLMPGPLGFPIAHVKVTRDTLLSLEGVEIKGLEFEDLLRPIDFDSPLASFRIERVYYSGRHAVAEGRILTGKGIVKATPAGRLERIRIEFTGGILTLGKFSLWGGNRSYPAEIAWRGDKGILRIVLRAE